MKKIAAGLFLGLLILAMPSLGGDAPPALREIIRARPSEGRYIFDFAQLFRYTKEGSEEHLGYFHREFNVELVIVTVPTVEGREITQVAPEIFTHWGIGRKNGGRGVLFLLADKEKTLKVEVGYEVEDVFTDAFSRYIEEVQMKSHFLGGEVDEGFMVTLEEFIRRANGTLTDEEITRKISQHELLSGGAGIKKAVVMGGGGQRQVLSPAEKIRFAAQPTPGKTFEKFLETLKEYVTDPDLGIFTEASRLMTKSYAPITGEKAHLWHQNWSEPHRLFEQGDRAVILWPHTRNNWLFFLVRTAEGWQIDSVSARKWAKQTWNNEWYLCGNNHPYLFAFKGNEYEDFIWDIDCFDDYGSFSGIEGDFETHLQALQDQLVKTPSDPKLHTKLGEIYLDLTIDKSATAHLEQSLRLDPEAPRPYLYLGLIHRDFRFAHETAGRYFKEYLDRVPGDPDGYHYLAVNDYQWAVRNVLDQPESGSRRRLRKAAQNMETYAVLVSEKNAAYGYEKAGWYRKLARDYDGARRNFQKVLRLEPDNEYAREMLAKLEGMGRGSLLLRFSLFGFISLGDEFASAVI